MQSAFSNCCFSVPSFNPHPAHSILAQTSLLNLSFHSQKFGMLNFSLHMQKPSMIFCNWSFDHHSTSTRCIGFLSLSLLLIRHLKKKKSKFNMTPFLTFHLVLNFFSAVIKWQKETSCLCQYSGENIVLKERSIRLTFSEHCLVKI